MAGNPLMALHIQGPAGLSYFTRSELAYAEIVKVTRESVVLYKVDANPGETEFMHTAGTGRIDVDPNYPFNFAMLDENGARIIEKVSVLYKRPAQIYVPPEQQENQ